jgi:hypothetical protein
MVKSKTKKHIVNNTILLNNKTKKIDKKEKKTLLNTLKLNIKDFNYFQNKQNSNIILNKTATYITKLIEYKDSKEAEYANKYLLEDVKDKNKLQQTRLFYAIKNEYTKFQNKVTTQNSVENKKLNFTLNEDFPNLKIIYQVIHNSYIINNKDKIINKFNLIYSTNTLVFYKNNNIIIVGIRGTADARDVRADLLLPLGLLNKTERYIEDFNVMKKIHKEYNENIFYGVGHSLGSTIIDRFLQEELLNQAISFNPAVEKGYFNNTNNKRIYIESDPLYKTMGKYANNIEVIKKPNKMLNKTLSNSAIMNFKSKLISSHSLTNFNDLLIE